ncbi:MAG: GerMN domain-containing protein [Anaerolineales bacterium]
MRRWILFSALVAVLLATASCTSAQAPVLLYYYNPEQDKDAAGNLQCSAAGLVPVQRALSGKTDDLGRIAWTIHFLLEGQLTDEERAQGLTTEFPLEGVELLNVVLQDGVLTLTFADPNFSTSGGACRTAILWAQIEQTALQFPGVDQVRFEPESLFQP